MDKVVLKMAKNPVAQSMEKECNGKRVMEKELISTKLSYILYKKCPLTCQSHNIID